MTRLVVRPGGPLRGTARVPGDKSIAHRWLLLAATAEGASEIDGLPQADDVRSTVACVVRVTRSQPGLVAWLEGDATAVRVEGDSYGGLRQPDWPLDCGNSGTTMRLLAGVLAGRPFASVLEGDESLSARPMERVADPLRRMGADVHTEDGHAPLQVIGGELEGITYPLPVPSSQVKGAVLLAGAQASGETVVDAGANRDPQSPGAPVLRDHTERALRALGVPVETGDGRVTVRAHQHPGFRATVPGDASSAVYLLAAACIVPLSEVEVRDVGVNPTRLGFLDSLTNVGETQSWSELDEPIGSLSVSEALLEMPLRVPAAGFPAVIDEVPALAAVACNLPGESRFEGAAELRLKESDRLEGLVLGIRGLGGEAEVQGDDLVVGGGGLPGGEADSQGDHRLAMALAVAALGARRESVIHGAHWAAVSFPGFAEALRSLGADVEAAE